MNDMATIDLAYVQRFKDRHGRVRHYYRRKGFSIIALPGDPGSVDFMTAYAQAHGRAPKADPASKVHGLRKAAGRRLAEAGATTKEIAAVLGHTSLDEVETYTRSADQAKLADTAIAKLKKAEKRTPRVKP